MPLHDGAERVRPQVAHDADGEAGEVQPLVHVRQTQRDEQHEKDGAHRQGRVHAETGR